MSPSRTPFSEHVLARRLAHRILPLVALAGCAEVEPGLTADPLLAPDGASEPVEEHVFRVAWHGRWSPELHLAVDGVPLPTAQQGQGPVILRARLPQAGEHRLEVWDGETRLHHAEVSVGEARGPDALIELGPDSLEEPALGSLVRVCIPEDPVDACAVPKNPNDARIHQAVDYATDHGLVDPLDVDRLDHDPAFPDECCFRLNLTFEPVEDTGAPAGRPFTVATESRLAPLRPDRHWAEDSFATLPLSEEARALAAARWLVLARAEHASVASFARFQLELMGLGAPADLLLRAARAQADEVAHARLAFALAAHLGRSAAPGPLPLHGALDRGTDVEGILVGAILEGCVEETVAAAEVRAAATVAHANLRARLNQVAEDETRHAELSWAFVRWLLDEHPALRPVAERTFAELDLGPRPAPADIDLAPAGLLGPVERWSVRRAVLTGVVLPAAHALLAR